MRDLGYQTSLIILGVISTLLFGIFLWREVYPEYRIYQNIYEELEEFRTTYTGEPAPAFQRGIKQIVIEREDKGPATIDRCTSCHVAVQFPAFSSTRIDHDINGRVVLNEQGFPKQVPNEDYVWGRLNAKIKELRDEKVIAQLKAQGDEAKISERLREAQHLESLKTVQVDDLTFDVTKVLAMHPLMGNETRPFEFHPLEEYGCTSCHSGNGRGLTTVKAHGPVFDDQYEIEYEGPKPEFLEKDEHNDPLFAKMFNFKPGSHLLFQTTPILIGSLVQSKCVQCHQLSEKAFSGAVDQANQLLAKRTKVSDTLEKSFVNEQKALLTLIQLKNEINEKGIEETLKNLKVQLQNYALPPEEYNAIEARSRYLSGLIGSKAAQDLSAEENQKIGRMLDAKIVESLGDQALARQLMQELSKKEAQPQEVLSQFIQQHQGNPQARGTLFITATQLNLEKEIGEHAQEAKYSFDDLLRNQKVVGKIQSDVDLLTGDFQKGKQLYFSQACYACHRIAGTARGGVGPELTNIGKSYPWYIKESIVWPQADLKTSTMPNYHLDHQQLEPLLTYLFAQVGGSQSVSAYDYKSSIQQWEAGKKTPLEMPIQPYQIQDLDYSMTVFATEGCAACHRFNGYQSNVGFAVEKGEGEETDLRALIKEKEWFTALFPESINGSRIVELVDQHQEEIDQRIVDGVREKSLLEEIERQVPGLLQSFYANFQYAQRAKNHHYQELAEQEADPLKKQEILRQQALWQERMHRLLMMYIQEYGLGRLIGPKPSWSGVWRSDEWLMEHFYKPSAHVSRSIMPVMPFDTTKFYALTYMLDVLGKRNRDQQRAIWDLTGFNPEQAVQIHCVQCHGDYLTGNGPVAEWIYPIPKNLRNAEFLRNLTKERVIDSITHGVKGTPMPPMGEAPMDKPTADGKPVLTADEIRQITNWLFNVIPGGTLRSPRDIPKWDYTPEDVLQELKDEGNQPKLDQNVKMPNREQTSSYLQKKQEASSRYWAALDPQPASQPREESEVARYFDVVDSPAGPDKQFYYIKKKYYTKENLEAGKAFFEVNCAVCHGADGDGAGARAGIMRDAKPRMLTNLDWIQSRDDLRLLRSIKYGVTGTSMTPWGDLTSSLQRMQLVMYVRSLTQINEQMRELSDAIYQVFGATDALVERSRIEQTQELAILQKEYLNAKRQQETLSSQASTDPSKNEQALDAYKKQLLLNKQLQVVKRADDILKNIKALIEQEGKLYSEIGSLLINRPVEENTFASYLEILAQLGPRFEINEGVLNLIEDPEREGKVKQAEEHIVGQIQNKITQLEQELVLEKAKIPSLAQVEKTKDLQAEVELFKKMRIKLISHFEQAKRLRQQQQNLLKDYREAGARTAEAVAK